MINNSSIGFKPSTNIPMYNTSVNLYIKWLFR